MDQQICRRHNPRYCSGGLGCVINGQGIMICIAMGYPDEAFVANDVKSRRKDNDSLSSKLRSLGSR